MGEFGSSKFGERLNFHHRKCRDLFWAVLYLLHILGIAFGIIYIYGYQIPKYHDDQPDSPDIKGSDLGGVFITIIVCSAFGITIGLIWTEMLKKFPEIIVKAMLFGNIVVWFIMAFVGVGVIDVGLMVAGFCISAIFGVYVWCMFPSIPFSTVLMRIASSILSFYDGTLLVGIFVIIMDLGFLFLWGSMAFGYLAISSADPSTKDPEGWIIFLMLLSLYWAIFVNKTVLEFTTCGAATAWYFSIQNRQAGNELTGDTLKIALTKSFGSICIGSILIPIFESLHKIVRVFYRQTGRRSSGKHLCDCLLSCINTMQREFNPYGYVHCAVYGTPFIESSQRVWDLFGKENVDLIGAINDEITGIALFCAGLVSAVVNGCIGWMIGWMFYKNSDINDWKHYMPIALGVYGGVIGWMFTMSLLTVIRACISVTFALFAEQPFVLQKNRTNAYNMLINVNPKFSAPLARNDQCKNANGQTY